MQDEEIRNYLDGSKIKNYVNSNLIQSLSDIGFSKKTISDLTVDLKSIDPTEFGKRHSRELENKYRIGFFQKHVPTYFTKFIVNNTPNTNKLIDIGCGTGILAKLYSKSKKAKEIFGIDINPYQEWKEFKNESVKFQVVKEYRIIIFLKKEQPDTVLITWTLHHMEYSEQERYIKYVSNVLKSGSRLIILEDSYSEKMEPLHGLPKYKEFMKLSKIERKKVMSVFDWVANRILAQRNKVPIPCTYRTLEEWEKLFTKNGFETEFKQFIGFPSKRDINTPQSLIIFRKA